MQPGDRLVFARADGLYDVLGITASGEEETRRSGLATLDEAYRVARSGLEGGRLWWRHHDSPNTTEPYRIST
jgi:hypothetical protein